MTMAKKRLSPLFVLKTKRDEAASLLSEAKPGTATEKSLIAQIERLTALINTITREESSKPIPMQKTQGFKSIISRSR